MNGVDHLHNYTDLTTLFEFMYSFQNSSNWRLRKTSNITFPHHDFFDLISFQLNQLKLSMGFSSYSKGGLKFEFDPLLILKEMSQLELGYWINNWLN